MSDARRKMADLNGKRIAVFVTGPNGTNVVTGVGYLRDNYRDRYTNDMRLVRVGRHVSILYRPNLVKAIQVQFDGGKIILNEEFWEKNDAIPASELGEEAANYEVEFFVKLDAGA
tara:strand:+ start:1843 stop:2187 length:345 start_codon:yes stop_codon:yes gene_type:complete